MTDETLKRVKKRGRMGDTFDDALNRILDDFEKIIILGEKYKK
jgi:hypothetical protein